MCDCSIDRHWCERYNDVFHTASGGRFCGNQTDHNSTISANNKWWVFIFFNQSWRVKSSHLFVDFTVYSLFHRTNCSQSPVSDACSRHYIHSNLDNGRAEIYLIKLLNYSTDVEKWRANQSLLRLKLQERNVLDVMDDLHLSNSEVRK